MFTYSSLSLHLNYSSLSGRFAVTDRSTLGYAFTNLRLPHLVHISRNRTRMRVADHGRPDGYHVDIDRCDGTVLHDVLLILLR